MDPITLAALISGGLQVGKSLFGASQASKSKKEMEGLRKDRPQYATPESAKQALALSKQQAYGDMPGQDYLEGRLGQATAAGVRRTQQVAGSSSAALGALTDIYGKRLDAERDLGYQAAQYKNQAMQRYQGALGQMANYEDQAFNINQWQPYQTRMNELSEQRMSGQQNFWGGLQGEANVGLNYMGTQAQMGSMDKMFPQGGGQPQTQPFTSMGAFSQQPTAPFSNMAGSYLGTPKPIN